MKSRLQWKWFGVLALLVALLLISINIGIDAVLTPYLTEKVKLDLQRDLPFVEKVFAERLSREPINYDEINSVSHELAQKTGLRLTVIRPDGVVIAESDKPQSEVRNMENHLLRPEVQAALSSGMGSAVRHSDTLKLDFIYIAGLIKQNGDVVAVLRIAAPLRTLQETTLQVRHVIAYSSILIECLSIPFIFWIARSTGRPIAEMRDMAMEVARGNFTARTELAPVVNEFRDLGKALNEMAEQLERRVKELQGERNELQTMLSCMVDGLMLVDAGGKVRLVNQSIMEQFHISGDVNGKSLIEVFRNTSLQEIVDQSLEGRSVEGEELTFIGVLEKTFSVNAAPLKAADGKNMGAVVVFHDITRLKQLENVRKDFVANVSHELRTPLSIIKGYVETLLDDSTGHSTLNKKFLTTIAKHSQRLESLINDLLTISSLESNKVQMSIQPSKLRHSVQSAIDELMKRAQDKNIALINEVSEQLFLKYDSGRLHQVFINFLDNAIKYTSPSCIVSVQAISGNNEVQVCVKDNGPGIPAEHVPHLFERFYRVDKARSRDEGGTGLGLSIVKHIVQAHGGKVWAESEEGKGSSFYFSLPD